MIISDHILSVDIPYTSGVPDSLRRRQYHDGSIIATPCRCHNSCRVRFTKHGSTDDNDLFSLCVGNVGHDHDDETVWAAVRHRSEKSWSVLASKRKPPPQQNDQHCFDAAKSPLDGTE
jgi:hypothetical protein